MRHLKKGRKFGRERGQRKAFMNILANNLIQHGRITTTEARAKELRPFIEKLITQGKKQDLQGLRILMKRLPKDSAYKLFHEIAPNYQEREGGYTRIVKQSFRRVQDGSKQAVIEFV
ncbi:MAG: 50S ribosomal protein L17 [Candidatus Paceibacterota bacterium]